MIARLSLSFVAMHACRRSEVLAFVVSSASADLACLSFLPSLTVSGRWQDRLLRSPRCAPEGARRITMFPRRSLPAALSTDAQAVSLGAALGARQCRRAVSSYHSLGGYRPHVATMRAPGCRAAEAQPGGQPDRQQAALVGTPSASPPGGRLPLRYVT